MTIEAENSGAAAPVAEETAGGASPAEAGDTGVPTPESPAPEGEEGSADSASPSEGAAAATATEAAPGPQETPKKDWKDDRIRVLTAKLREAQKAEPPAAADLEAAAPVVSEAEVQRRVQELSAVNEFNRRCNEAAEGGRKDFQDFDAKIDQLQQLVTPGDPQEAAAYTRMIEAALETGEASRLLYELGNNPEMALRIMQMTPVRQGIEMAKLAAKRGTPEPSTAAKPINPVGGRGRTSDEINPSDPTRADNLSGRTWIERRQREVDARRKAGEQIW